MSGDEPRLARVQVRNEAEFQRWQRRAEELKEAKIRHAKDTKQTRGKL